MEILLPSRSWCTESDLHGGCIVTPDGSIAAYLPGSKNGLTGAAQDHAAMFAAAPELLSALQDAEFLLRKAGQLAGPMQDSFKRSAEDARAAIAKATSKP